MADITVRTQVLDRSDLQTFIPVGNFRLIKAFENLMQDVSTTIPEAIETAIEGPSGSVDGDLVLFDGADGKKVRDSGVNINQVALLDSPVFTGDPRAPTPPPGDNDTSIATTAFVTAANVAKVTGPVSAVDNDIALFNGATGKIIKDSGVQLSALAPLASPVFTGNPTAPTPALGDNDTSIATTAFVQAAITAGAVSFSAHNNSVAQSIPNAAFTKLTFSTTQYNDGSAFASSTWTPPANLVSLAGAVTFSLTVATRIGISIFKNGVEFKRGTIFTGGSAGSVVTAMVACQDKATGTDTYEAWAFQDSGVPLNTVGGSPQTYFQGTSLTP